MTVKELKKGRYFTRKAIENPTEMQVWIRGDYDREQKKYECQCFGDMNSFCYLKGAAEIYTDFTF